MDERMWSACMLKGTVQLGQHGTTIIYRYPRLSKVSGDSPKQVGAPGSKLLHPFTVQVRDGSGSTGNSVPGQVVTFTSSDGTLSDGTFSAHPYFPDDTTNKNIPVGTPQTVYRSRWCLTCNGNNEFTGQCECISDPWE